ncbi:uncharacterized protein N7473_006199 [Penicillium subrubescens]|uniref:uncharacterized protein n=1 Tax=Penicillium subrubescens TaxID=1316194 RepID=UPI0025455752|nr:uncharacterized protein N7473_006199 [Penicillium subrubescens]KAJ5896800.1 hypothetical protein N7473_006199 [Penicillium subrubescens]
MAGSTTMKPTLKVAVYDDSMSWNNTTPRKQSDSNLVGNAKSSDILLLHKREISGTVGQVQGFRVVLPPTLQRPDGLNADLWVREASFFRVRPRQIEPKFEFTTSMPVSLTSSDSAAVMGFKGGSSVFLPIVEGKFRPYFNR